MKIYLSKKFKKKLDKFYSQDKKIIELVDKQLSLFKASPTHPSLRLHKISRKKLDDWSITIKGNLRIIFTFYQEGILLVDIGSHDEVY